ncbi:DegV family protein [Paenibacillus mesotrionivorans]|uniref:DegV family protein n=1 Tax=Paenibacillus mesotrionivorans TaxID=3160968 RepID=A0ACC7P1N1_9BACL
MGRICIVTDSTSDIPPELRESLSIEMVPLKVHFGDEAYLDGITISPEDFYVKLAGEKRLPTTSQPSPLDFLAVYNRLAAEPGTVIISIHLSSSFSGTYQSACMAKGMLETPADITVVDSRTATYGIGLLVVEAARAAKAGESKEYILKRVEELRKQTTLYFLVDTLEYLHKGGRIGKAGALLGSLLQIKPILSVEDGTVVSVDKIRGTKKAMIRIMERLAERYQGPVRVAVAHANSMEYAEELSALIHQQFEVVEMMYTTIGPVIGTHVGGGTVGVFMVPAHGGR